MKKNMLNFIVLVCMLISCSAPTPVPTPSAADIEKEEQTIYSLFLHDAGGAALILQDTSSEISTEKPQQSIDYIQSGLKSISSETLNNYLSRNAQPSQLSPDMNLGMDYVLLSADELAEIFSQPNWNQFLAEKYPGSYGLYTFSRVGFNNSLDQAVIYVGNVAAPMMGAGFYYLMEKKNGKWLIKEQVNVWMS